MPSRHSSCKIFQNFYNEKTKSYVKPYFVPYDNTNGKSDEYEYGVMRKVYQDPDTWAKDTHMGVLSWKFESKINYVYWLCHAKKRTSLFYDWDFKCAANHYSNEYDLITMNPFVVDKLVNIWDQGELYHDGLKETALHLFVDSGMDPRWLNYKHDRDTLCFCNYWVANKKFWSLYMMYTEPIYALLATEKYESVRPLHPYIMERMFSTILAMHKGSIRSIPLGLSPNNPVFPIPDAARRVHPILYGLTKYQ